MILLNFTDYARHRGVSPGYITKLRHEGRLVLSADRRRVDVEASDKLIEQTAGTRADVAARHAQQRQDEKTQHGVGHTTAGDEKTAPGAILQLSDDELLGSGKQGALAMKEKYSALKAKAEYETMIGDLIRRDDVDTAMRFIGAAVRASFEVFPDQTAPLVAPVSDLAEIHDILTQSARDALHGIGEEIKRQQSELVKVIT
jgi:hypothetical protein